MPEAADWAAETEARLLLAALPHVLEMGFTSRLVHRAAGLVGLTPAEAELLLPGGARDLAALFSYRHDAAALTALARIDSRALKIRERISRGVEARVETAMAEEAAARRWAGFLALPQNLALGARLAWESADRIWRWAGDTATDENHYSKRAILAALITSTFALRLSDPAAARRSLERGIETVMAYERVKARFKGRDPVAEAAAALGRIRHGRAPMGSDSTPA